MYIKRFLESQVLAASEQYPVVLVCGQRQVGKSTMLYHIKGENRRYVTLDDSHARHLALTDPGLFLETYGTPLFIDEFQRAPGILLEIKRIVDEKALKGEDANGLFWLTGSQKFRMMNDVSESLAGRIAIFEMSGLSSREIRGCEQTTFIPDIEKLRKESSNSESEDIHEVFEHIFRGGMPKIIASDVDRDRYYMDYINTYINRDVRDLAQVGKIDEFNQFLIYMAANTAQELKYDAISKEIGVSAPTIKQWVSILETLGLIFILRPYFPKITNRYVKTPKCYFTDTGLAAYLTRWPDADTLENGNAAGAFFETYVITEILKSRMNAGIDPGMYYYRDIDQREIDLIIEEGRCLYPIEIKKARNPSVKERNLKVLNKSDRDIKPAVVLCMTSEFVPLSKDVWLCPISVI